MHRTAPGQSIFNTNACLEVRGRRPRGLMARTKDFACLPAVGLCRTEAESLLGWSNLISEKMRALCSELQRYFLGLRNQADVRDEGPALGLEEVTVRVHPESVYKTN